MRILLTGGTGLIGRALCQHWQRQGHDLFVWSRDPAQVPRLCSGAQGIAQLQALNGSAPLDAVVNLAGAPIADRPWTAARRDLLLIIKTALMSEGYSVETANNGLDAIAMAQDNTPDLVILDMMMPEMNGFEVLAQLRQQVNTERTPVIMLTGISEKGTIREALDSGIHFYIVKPFEFHDLLSKVKLAIADAEGGGLAGPSIP